MLRIMDATRSEDLNSDDLSGGDPIPPLATRRVQVGLAVTLIAATCVAGASSFLSARRLPPVVPSRATLTGKEMPRPLGLRIDINRAPRRELSLLPGVGPVLAARIVADRESGGNFASLDDLARVPGIGPKTIDRIAPMVIVGLASPERTGSFRVASNR